MGLVEGGARTLIHDVTDAQLPAGPIAMTRISMPSHAFVLLPPESRRTISWISIVGREEFESR
ncbi:hypothetical protein C5748_25810 [Phyllobacterium phragmitis]|uniref:Uncharacterized protein n=1 Tax=Phyllobacterium phragmitis TaxID=2670329 RepID=A0A2S9IJD6_9HYPH|nr:hypothetical protein C5748_25810 [Phyllobacterium phragmitis]